MSVQNVLKSTRVFVTQMECSLSTRQQKHKMKENLFCSSIWEKHLAESWWEGERRRGRERKEDKGCVRDDLSVLGFMDFFFFFSVCEFCTAYWDGSSLCSVSGVEFQSSTYHMAAT